MKIYETYKSQIKESFIRNYDKNPLKGKTPVKDRIEYLDLAKGVCILLVVFYHCDLFKFSIPNFETFRIPLFILLSGIFFKEDIYSHYLIKKNNTIIMPLLFWLMISEGLHILYSVFKCDNVIERIIANPSSHYIFEPSNGPLWFLVCLFFTSLIYLTISKLTRSILWRGIISIFIAIIGYIIFLNGINLPLWIDTSMIVIPFFFMGNCLKDLGMLNFHPSKYKLLIASLIFMPLGYVIYYISGEPEAVYVKNFYSGSIGLIYLNNIFLLTGSFCLFKFIEWLPLINYIGKNSLIILCIHMPMVIYIDRYVERLTGIEITSLERFILVILICWIAIPIVKTLLPWFSGERPLFKVSTKKSDTLSAQTI